MQSILITTKKNSKNGGRLNILIDLADNDKEIYKIIDAELEKKKYNGKKVIDYLIITHSDSDHVGNLKRILKYAEIKKVEIKNIIYEIRLTNKKLDREFCS